ncbi:ATP-binding protein [Spirulina sp. CS-785/01]|uniref:sensor histidine kinase n=1 Tax=Spirulina sp. CS-785/01 TaxID=3021716 RepID=UPI00232AD6BD|nr:ATP-binding protein [Spirulina sp. CS-785/01]MDB9315738.1 ATP-binding protein [Spirulina sp. CS-785/01]
MWTEQITHSIVLFSWLSEITLVGIFFSLPMLLLYQVSKRRNVPSNWLTLLSVSFAITLGLNHFLHVVTPLWRVSPLISTGVNLLTASLGVATLVQLIPKMSQLLSLPSANQLILINHVLENEVNERKQAQQNLKHLNEDLEQRVEQRTLELRHSQVQLLQQNQQLEQTLRELQNTQSQLIQSEKMSSLGQMVAGLAHEINNPVNFIYGNLSYLQEYTQDLLKIIDLYEQECITPSSTLQEALLDLDIEFVKADCPKLLQSMNMGVERICEIVLSLRNFSRHDEAEMKPVHLYEGIDSTLKILHNRLKAKDGRPGITIQKNYQDLPKIACYAGQVNQVFMNLLSNAIDALEEQLETNPGFSPQIDIDTRLIKGANSPLQRDTVEIRIRDNGVGIPENKKNQLFDPFFTTKPVGKGTGLGLSISYQIVVERHQGQLYCKSKPNQGTEFVVLIPVHPQDSVFTLKPHQADVLLTAV